MAYRDVIVISSDSPSPPPPSPPPLPAQPNLLDYLEDDLEVALNVGFDDNNSQFLRGESPQMPAILRSSLGPGAENEGSSKCEEDVLSCFPDICPDYLKTQVVEHQFDSQGIITRLLDDLEKNKPYPKRPISLKRKRPETIEKDDEEEMRRKFDDEDPGLANKDQVYKSLYIKMGKALLKSAFHQRYAEDVESTLKANNHRLYKTYLVLDKASWSPEAEPIKLKKVNALQRAIARRAQVEQTLRHNATHQAEIDALAAFDAARAVCMEKARVRESKEAELKQKAQVEEENFQRAKAEGAVADCGCCYGEYALSSMVHCAGDTTHWFCRTCAKTTAENLVGFSKYQLGCMSTHGCDATFSRDQRELFLDDKLANALELIEQEAVLRLAGIENLESCPFCPYAAEYPPVEENKEFRCENPDCHLVSCRLCRKETHIPKACGEAEKERGHSARRTIEEAMSDALIRKCNKCGSRFIKENGCNKMTCTQTGCRNTQCYVCSKTCDYGHFDDASRGGKQGNCPLFDNVEVRHRNEIHAAEALARQKVAEEHPEVGEELLDINFSQKVKDDDDARRRGIYPAQQVPPANRAPPPAPLQERLAELHNQARLLQQQAQDRQRQFDRQAREMMQASIRAQMQMQAQQLQGQAQLLQGHLMGRAQQAPAQQKPVAQLGHPQPFGYHTPYITKDFAAFLPATVLPAAPRAPATIAVSAAPTAVAAPIAEAAPSGPAEPKADDRFKPLHGSNFAAGRRSRGEEQAAIRVIKCNAIDDEYNDLLDGPYNHAFDTPYNNPFSPQFGIQFGSPWAPGAAIQAQGQFAQPGHPPNQQQEGGAGNKIGAPGTQFPAGFAFPNMGDFAMPDILNFANPGRQGGFVIPEIEDAVFPPTPDGERRQ